jgi:flavin reductase (DIM6/NTAB) family NADH-FMN oxidoreductase RutF
MPSPAADPFQPRPGPADEPPPVRSLPADALSADEMYLLLRDSVMPRPIAWVSTVDAAGAPNLSPYSFFNVCSSDPPVLGFSVGAKGRDARGQPMVKDTLANVRATGELVVNIVPEYLTRPMVLTSANLPPGDSEFAFAGLPPAPSSRVRPPRVAGAPVAFECTVYSVIEIGTSWWVMGRVVHVQVDERVYLGRLKGLDHRIDLLRAEGMRPVGRLGRALYAYLRDVEAIARPDGPND